MSHSRLAIVLALLLPACGAIPPPCDASTCNGCCDARGECQRGDGTLECGVRGNLCQSCLLGQSCVAGVCSQASSGSGGGSSTAGGGTAGGWAGGGAGPTAGGMASMGGGTAGGRVSMGGGTAGGMAPMGGGSAGGVESLVNRSACTGTGQASGSVAGQPLASGAAQAQEVTGGDVSIAVFQAPMGTGSRLLLIEFTPIANQLSYSVSETRCGVAERTATSWRGVEPLAACEVQFAQLSFASSAGVCSGTMVGQMTGLASGNVPVWATFAVPVNFLRPQSTRCRSTGASCSAHSECCTQSCSLYIGVCN
jgi:hypothetical protein